jgi:DNA-directed RNA polymerase beta subunit
VHFGKNSGNLVFVNGEIIGVTPTVGEFCSEVRELKRKNMVSCFASVGIDVSGVHVNCDSGSLYRPVFHLPALRLLVSQGYRDWALPGAWEFLRKSGAIVYFDKAEDSSLYISTNIFQDFGSPDTVYAEIHPASFLGIPATLIPSSDHNQAPRNIYSTNMLKQAIGIPSLDYTERCDPTNLILNYAQKPIVSTIGNQITNITELPAGVNAVVMIAMYDGWNMEDALVINRAATERGLFDIGILHTYTDEVSPNPTDGQNFCIPDKGETQGLRAFDYSRLEEDGFPCPGTFLNSGDPVIGKTVSHDSSMSSGDLKERTIVDRSTTVTHKHDTSVVLDVRLSITRQ